MITWSEGGRRYSSFKAFSKVSDSWSMQFNSGRSLTIDNGSCEFGWRILPRRWLFTWSLPVSMVHQYLWRAGWCCGPEENFGRNLFTMEIILIVLTFDCDSNSMEKPTIVLMSSAVSRSKCEKASSTFISVVTQYSYTLCRSLQLVVVSCQKTAKLKILQKRPIPSFWGLLFKDRNEVHLLCVS